MADQIRRRPPVRWIQARSLRFPPPDGRPMVFGVQDGGLAGLAPLAEGREGEPARRPDPSAPDPATATATAMAPATAPDPAPAPPSDTDPGLETLLERAEAQLGAYLKGERRRLDLPCAPGGTPFQIEVWSAVRKIPYGATATYKDIAAAIGRSGASRAVGQALGANPLPIIIPCHRVVGSGGRIGGYALGLGIKRFLLDLENRAGPPGPCDGTGDSGWETRSPAWEAPRRLAAREAPSAEAAMGSGRAPLGRKEDIR